MNKLENMLAVALVVPMKRDPSDPNCVFGLPICIWGPPGIGKSSRVEVAGRSVGLVVEPVYPATRQPEDFSGAPVPDGKGSLKIECILGAARSLIEEGKGVLFIDEVSCARPAVQAALLSVVLDRRIGDILLPPAVRVVLAANPPDLAAGGWELEPPMANRMAHYEEKAPTAKDWTDWLMSSSTSSNDTPPIENAQERVIENWADAWSRATGLAYGFMQRRPGLLYDLPGSDNPDRGRAWPSPRTWEFALRAVATCYALKASSGGVNDTKRTNPYDMLALDFVEACVGKGAAIEWAKWLAEADLPDPLDMLTKGWWPDKTRIDKSVAAMSAMVTYVITRTTQDERVKFAPAAYTNLCRMSDSGMTDLTLPAVKILVDKGLTSSASPEIEKAMQPIMLKVARGELHKYLT